MLGKKISNNRMKLLGLFIVFVFLFITVLPVYAADNVFDRYRQLEQNINDGRGLSDEDDAGTLAWGEAYILDSYLDNYEAYKDTYWLDKFVDHYDRIKSNAIDPENDGYYGWYSAKYSLQHMSNWNFKDDGQNTSASELITNGGFETYSDDAQTPSGWTREGGGSSVIYRTTTAGEYYSGNAGLKIKYNNGSPAIAKQQITYQPYQEYSVSLMVKTNNRHTAGKIEAYNETDSVVVGESVTFGHESVFVDEWMKVSFNFKAPASGKTLVIRLRLLKYDQPGWETYFDNISIKPVEGAAIDNIVNNYSFETLNSEDSTLPDSWTRHVGDSTKTYVSTSLNEYYDRTSSDQRGLVVKIGTVNIPTIKQQLQYTPNQEYTVVFQCRTNTPDISGEVAVADSTAGQYLGSLSFSNTKWKQKSFTVTAPSVAGHSVDIRIRIPSYSTEDYRIYIDNVQIRPVQKRGIRGWDRVNKDSSTAYISNFSGEFVLDSAYADFGGLVVGNNGQTDGYVEQRFMAYEGNKPYSVYFRGRTNNASTGAKVIVYDETSSQILAEQSFYNTDFKSLEVDFTTPSNTNNVVKIRLTQTSYNNSSHKANFDNVCVGQKISMLVDDAAISKPGLRFIKTIYDDTGLQTSYMSKADTYLSFIKDDVLPFWDSYYKELSGDKAIYVYPEGNAGRWFPDRSLPHNQYLIAAECDLYIYDITGINSYLTRATRLLNSFKSKLSVNTMASTAYQWKYWDEFSSLDPYGTWDDGFWYNSPVEDSSHANLDISAAVEGYHRGIIFNATDMGKMVSAFKDVMWNGSLSQPLIGARLNMEGAKTSQLYSYNNTLSYWVNLAEFDSQIWDIINAVAENKDNTLVYNWNTKTFSALNLFNREHLVNSGFELIDKNDSTLPAYWSRWLSTSSTAYRDIGNSYKGSAGLALVTNGSTWNVLEQEIKGYKPNSDYELKFFCKTDGSAVSGRGQVYNYTSATYLGNYYIGSTSWSQGLFTFTTPSVSGNNIRVRLYHNIYTPQGRQAYFDEVRVLPALWNSFVPNGGFELADYFDSALPRYWIRASGTLDGNAVLDSNNEFKGSSCLKIATSPAQGDQKLVYELNGFKPGASYKLPFYCKTNGSLAKAKAYVYNETTSTVLGSQVVDSTTWQKYEFTFIAPSTYTDTVKVYLGHDNSGVSGGEAYFDELGVLLQ